MDSIVKYQDVGFTGTQVGMTGPQVRAVSWLVTELKPAKAHHGLCIGADAQFHEIVKAKAPGATICGHPPIDKSKVADFDMSDFDHLEPDGKYLDRNQVIVDHSRSLVATPKRFTEEIYSGTWATVRRARKAGIIVFIVWPDGKVETERPE